MSSKKEKSHKKHDKNSDDGADMDQIPQWATQPIRPIDDPFHDDFEVEIVLNEEK